MDRTLRWVLRAETDGGGEWLKDQGPSDPGTRHSFFAGVGSRHRATVQSGTDFYVETGAVSLGTGRAY